MFACECEFQRFFTTAGEQPLGTVSGADMERGSPQHRQAAHMRQRRQEAHMTRFLISAHKDFFLAGRALPVPFLYIYCLLVAFFTG